MIWQIAYLKSDGTWRTDPLLVYPDREFALAVASAILRYHGREAACICPAGKLP